MTSVRHDLTTWRFWRHFATQTFAALGALAVLAELLSILFPDTTVTGILPTVALAVVALAYGAARAWPRPIEQKYAAPNTQIRVVEGDLLEQPDHLVVGTCDTFDTLPPRIIARNSVQGQVLERFFEDVTDLDRQLEEALGSRDHKYVNKEGKNERFEVGTVATLTNSARKFFFVAYSMMSEANVATSTPDAIWKSLLNLWQEVSQHGNGRPVSIPVIGGGQSRMSQVLPAQDSIRFIALSFMLASRREKICDELRIVVRPDDWERLDRLELQAFLASLRPS